MVVDIDTAFELSKVATASLAFVIALFAFFGREPRFRESAPAALVVVFIQVLATTFNLLAIALFTTDHERLATYSTRLSIVALTVGWLALFWSLYRAYGRVSHLRERRYLKYIFPFSYFWTRDPYVIQTIRRQGFSMPSLPLTPQESAYIADPDPGGSALGYSFLLVGSDTYLLRLMALEILADGVRHDETANYVSCEQHPYHVFQIIKRHVRNLLQQPEDVIFIDAFTPRLGFNDDILELHKREILKSQMRVLSAKTLAGVHSGGNSAWYFSRTLRRRQGRNTRRPNRIVYDKLSSFADSAGVDQVRAFVLHLLSSERNYGMITVLIESELTDTSLLNAMRDAVDAVIEVSTQDDARILVSGQKLSGLKRQSIGETEWNIPTLAGN